MVARLYAIDLEGLREVTDAGIGIPRRRPRLTAWELQLVRLQLEQGPCLAAFDAGIHRIVHTSDKLIEIDHSGAIPGLRT